MPAMIPRGEVCDVEASAGRWVRSLTEPFTATAAVPWEGGAGDVRHEPRRDARSRRSGVSVTTEERTMMWKTGSMILSLIALYVLIGWGSAKLWEASSTVAPPHDALGKGLAIPSHVFRH